MKRSAKKNSSKMHCTVWQMFLLVAKLGDFLTHTACPYLTYRIVQIDFVFAENDGQIIDHKKGFMTHRVKRCSCGLTSEKP